MGEKNSSAYHVTLFIAKNLIVRWKYNFQIKHLQKLNIKKYQYTVMSNTRTEMYAKWHVWFRLVPLWTYGYASSHHARLISVFNGECQLDIYIFPKFICTSAIWCKIHCPAIQKKMYTYQMCILKALKCGTVHIDWV